MKILLVTEYWKGGTGWSYAQHLRKLGQNVIIFDYRKSVLPFPPRSFISRGIRHLFNLPFCNIMNNHLIYCVKKNKPDFVFIVKGELIYPETIRKIRDISKIINWYVDPIYSFNDKNTINAARYYNILFVKDPAIVKIARIIGLKNVILLPEGYDELLYYPRKLKPEESQKYSSDISLVGFQYPYRLLAVSGIKGYNFKLWGKVTGDISYYPSLINCAENRFLTGIEKNIIFNASKISLNIQHIGEIDSLNVRSFEICGASGFQIMDYRETANNFYVIGKEIVTYNSLEELVKKINYYLKNSEERRKIALAGYKRAVKDHKLSSRLRILLNNVNKL